MMDQINTQEEMDEVLAEFGKINARFLNHWLIRGFLKKFLRQNQPTSILDLGTGGADIPIYLSLWARKRSRDLRICGIDTNPFAVDYARRQTRDFGNIEIKNEQVSDLSEQHDIIIVSQTIHHIPPHEIENFLQSVLAKAGRVVIISDFIRSRLAFTLAKIALRLVTKNPIHRHDGPTSVLRSYTSRELKGFFSKLGVSSYRIYNLFPRKFIVIRK